MQWNSIIGQQNVRQMLQRCILGGRIPQAMVLAGAEGTGTAAIALAFARALVCESPVNGTEPCGQCHSCRQSAGLQHPNIRVLCALPAGKGDTDDDMKPEIIDEIRAGLQTMAADPYTEMRVTGATQIRIGQIRELKRVMSLSGAQAGRRILIILRAEEMTMEAANAFLKTLEEPHDDVTMILTTSATERLLQTIVSRCQLVTCPPLDDADIAAALVQRGLATADEARLVAPFARGSYTQALTFLDEDMKSVREDAIALLRTALKSKDYRVALADAAAEVAEGRDKNKIVNMLSLLAIWLRDSHVIASRAMSIPLANGDQEDALIRFAEAFGHADMPAALQIIEASTRDIYRNVHPQLVVLTCMMQLRTLLLRARASARPAAGGASVPAVPVPDAPTPGVPTH